MSNRFAPALACLAGLTATAAIAQPAPNAPAPTAVAPVTVQAEPAKVIERQSQAFVLAYAAPTAKINQIARWRGAICVQVLGVIPDQAAAIKARIEAVAKSAGLFALPAGCRSTIQVIFTDKPQAVVDKVAQRNEDNLGFHYQADLKKLKTVTRPIQAWYATGTSSGAGASAVGLAFGTGGTQLSGPMGGGHQAGPDPANWQSNYGQINGVQQQRELVDSPDHPAPVGCADSPQFTSCLRSVFANVMIVVDSNALGGKTFGQLSDYLAMLALSQPKSLDGCNALPSVIDLFARTACPGRDPPEGLTPADTAYLAALYGSDPEAKMAMAQGDIAVRMAKTLIQANGVVGANAGSPSPTDAKAR